MSTLFNGAQHADALLVGELDAAARLAQIHRLSWFDGWTWWAICGGRQLVSDSREMRADLLLQVQVLR